MIKLSLVVPCFNEGTRFSRGAKTILRYLLRQKYSWELVFVNDGSRDRTLAMMKRLASRDRRIKVVSYRKNRGKGYALKKGCLAAQGNFIFFTDIDLSVPIQTLGTFWPYFEKSFDLVIGSRRVRGARILKHQFFLREFLGRGFTALVRFLLAPGIKDVTCGFKAFRSDAARIIFPKCIIERWAIDAEILFLARKFGFKIAQVPVSWSNTSETKVNVARDVVLTFGEVMRILANNLSGRYQKR